MRTYTYVLSPRESIFWNHRNDDIKWWGLNNSTHKATEAAAAAGCGKWMIFDVDEEYLATGFMMDEDE